MTEEEIMDAYTKELSEARVDMDKLKSKMIACSNNNATAIAMFESAAADFITKHLDVLMSMADGQLLASEGYVFDDFIEEVSEH